MDFQILTVHDVDQMRSVILVVNILFVVHEQYHPPMVPSAVDFTTTANFNICAVVDLNEVPVPFSY